MHIFVISYVDNTNIFSVDQNQDNITNGYAVEVYRIDLKIFVVLPTPT